MFLSLWLLENTWHTSSTHLSPLIACKLFTDFTLRPSDFVFSLLFIIFLFFALCIANSYFQEDGELWVTTVEDRRKKVIFLNNSQNSHYFFFRQWQLQIVERGNNCSENSYLRDISEFSLINIMCIRVSTYMCVFKVTIKMKNGLPRSQW